MSPTDTNYNLIFINRFFVISDNRRVSGNDTARLRADICLIKYYMNFCGSCGISGYSHSNNK